MWLLPGVIVSVADATPAIVTTNSKRNVVVASALTVLFNVFHSTRAVTKSTKFAYKIFSR